MPLARERLETAVRNLDWTVEYYLEFPLYFPFWFRPVRTLAATR